MKFTFKMFVLVGLILVGKFLKEDNTEEIVNEQDKSRQEVYNLKSSNTLPLTRKANQVVEPIIKQGSTDKTFTYSLN